MIHIVGLGTVDVGQVTPEAVRAIRASERVLFLSDDVATGAFLAQHNADVVDLGRHFVEGRSRIEAHHQVAADVVDAALSVGPVTFAVAGHPTHLVPSTFLIEDLAGLLGLSCMVLPGISALDQLLAELRIDPASHGLQSFEATDLLLRRRPVAADVPLVLWQVGMVESHLTSSAPSAPDRFARLTHHLLRYYPPQHTVVAVEARVHRLVDPVHHAFALESLPGHAAVLTPRTTLYIPPLGTRPIVDGDVVAGLTSEAHLSRITTS